MGRTRTRTAAGLVLDTGALIALERGDKRMIALLRRALAQGRAFPVPSGVVGKPGATVAFRLPYRGSCGAKRLRLFLLTTSLPVPAENSAAPRGLRM